ncbi:uncharacterized protein TNCV_71401 [Trichonephila clavipes]|nr:uncharacterized protein TNCV_71401 [Trichonephila clavipes]
MDVCKCTVPLRHGGILNTRRDASSLVWLVEVEERWEALGHPNGFLPLNWDGTEQNRTFTCIMLKPKDNETGVKILALIRDEFRGLRSDFVRQVALVTTQQQLLNYKFEKHSLYNSSSL